MISVDEPELDTLAGRAKSTLDQFVNKLFDALANSEEKAFAVREESSGSIKLIWSKEAKKGLQVDSWCAFDNTCHFAQMSFASGAFHG